MTSPVIKSRFFMASSPVNRTRGGTAVFHTYACRLA